MEDDIEASPHFIKKLEKRLLPNIPNSERPLLNTRLFINDHWDGWGINNVDWFLFFACCMAVLAVSIHIFVNWILVLIFASQKFVQKKRNIIPLDLVTVKIDSNKKRKTINNNNINTTTTNNIENNKKHGKLTFISLLFVGYLIASCMSLRMIGN